jgi:hypothetical protein
MKGVADEVLTQFGCADNSPKITCRSFFTTRREKRERERESEKRRDG